MNALSSEFLAAAMASTPENLKQALSILKGGSRPDPAAKPIVYEPFVTLEALSKITGLGRISLWRYAIPGHRLAGRMKYRTSEVLAYLESPQFQHAVKALKSNGWKRPSAAEITLAEQEHRPTGADSTSGGGNV